MLTAVSDVLLIGAVIVRIIYRFCLFNINILLSSFQLN